MRDPAVEASSDRRVKRSENQAIGSSCDRGGKRQAIEEPRNRRVKRLESQAIGESSDRGDKHRAIEESCNRRVQRSERQAIGASCDRRVKRFGCFQYSASHSDIPPDISRAGALSPSASVSRSCRLTVILPRFGSKINVKRGGNNFQRQ